MIALQHESLGLKRLQAKIYEIDDAFDIYSSHTERCSTEMNKLIA